MVQTLKWLWWRSEKALSLVVPYAAFTQRRTCCVIASWHHLVQNSHSLSLESAVANHTSCNCHVTDQDQYNTWRSLNPLFMAPQFSESIDWNISHVTNHCGPYETTSSQFWLDDGTTRAHTIPKPSLVTILSCYLKSISCFKRTSVFVIYMDLLSSENTANVEPLSFLCRKHLSEPAQTWSHGYKYIHPLHCGTQSLHNVLCCIMQIFAVLGVTLHAYMKSAYSVWPWTKNHEIEIYTSPEIWINMFSIDVVC